MVHRRARAAAPGWPPSLSANATAWFIAARIEHGRGKLGTPGDRAARTEGLREQTRARRWGIFFKLLTFAFLFVALLAVAGALTVSQRSCLDKCTAQVELRGELDADGPASAENVMAGLQAAFKNKGTQGVVLRINSPGGSPVQAGEINDEIRRLRVQYPAIPI